MSLFLGNCQCGGPFNVSFPYSRIINGFEVPPHSLPFQVFLSAFISETQTGDCGGSLISPRFVLTAAHCVEDIRIFKVAVVIGIHNVSSIATEQIKYVSNIAIHPLRNKATKEYDYAILTLSTPVVLSAFVGLICLPPDVTNTFAGASLASSGWGLIAGGGSITSKVLKAAYLTGMSNLDCSLALNIAPAKFAPSEMCVNGYATNSSVCSGDSGGNLKTCDCFHLLYFLGLQD